MVGMARGLEDIAAGVVRDGESERSGRLLG
jgi:hypothetical protein